MTFNNWLDTLVNEKNLDLEMILEVEGESGLNMIPLAIVLDGIKATGKDEQSSIKTTLVKIDFMNGDITHFFRHLAQALAI